MCGWMDGWVGGYVCVSAEEEMKERRQAQQKHKVTVKDSVKATERIRSVEERERDRWEKEV